MRKYIWLIALVFVGGMACSDEVSDGDNVRQGENDDSEDAGIEDGGGDDGGTDQQDAGSCEPGESLGCEDEGALRVCDESGDGEKVETCPEEAPNCLDGECTDRICEPGQAVCSDGQTRAVCDEEGTGYEDEVPCGEGQVCEHGSCETACEMGPKMAQSYFGCEYWTVYLDQYDDPTTGMDDAEIPHAVVLSNPNDVDATIHFQAQEPGITFDIDDPVVPAGDSRSFVMPRMPLEETGKTHRGIFIQSSMPVTAHQFNPLNNEDVYSNDASLLLPVSSLGKEYYAMSWPTQGVDMDDFEFDIPFLWDNDFDFDDLDPQQGYVTIVATQHGTTNVNVESTADIEEGDGIAEFPAGVTRSFQLSYGEVLNLQADAGGMQDGLNDLTGTHIVADQSVAVFGGHEQAVVAYDDDRESCCADHIEQQMVPLESWGDRYIAPFSPGRTETKDHWRILAGEDGVTVETEPAQPEADGVTLEAGEFVEFFTDDDFEVEANGKITVGQYLTGQQQTAEITGDPALVLAVPIERWRDDYHVLVPEDYDRDFITVIRPEGLEVELNGEPVDDTEFEPVGSGEFESGYVEVDPGVYVVESVDETPFAVVAHGLDNAVSYGYPGGMNMVGADAAQE